MSDSTYRIQSLARGLAILSEVAESEGDLTAAELSRRVGVSRQTSYHLLHTLRQIGYVEQHSDQRYRLGWAVTSLVDGYKRQVTPPVAVTGRLTQLREATSETCSLSVWSGDDVVLIAQEPGDHQVRVADIQVGQRGALHARASAKILLARADEQRRERILTGLSFKRFTENTITRRARFNEELRQVTADGWAEDREELAEHITCISACLQHEGTDFAFAVLAPTDRYRAHSEKYREALLDATRP